MITSLFINFFWGVLKLLIALLPPMTLLPPNWTDAWDFFATRISYFFYIIPAHDTMLTILTLTILFEVGIFTFKIIEKIYSWIPFKAT